MTAILDKISKSEHFSACAAKSAHGIATPDISQAPKPRQLLIAVFSLVGRGGKPSGYPLLWAGLQIPLVRSPEFATSCGRLNDEHRRTAMRDDQGADFARKPPLEPVKTTCELIDAAHRIYGLVRIAHFLSFHMPPFAPDSRPEELDGIDCLIATLDAHMRELVANLEEYEANLANLTGEAG